MYIKFDPSNTFTAFCSLIDTALKQQHIKTIFILVGSDNQLSFNDVDQKLKEIPIPVLGGIYPEIIFKKQCYIKGMILVGLDTAADCYVVPELSNPNIIYDDILDEKITNLGNKKTMLVLVDGLSSRISALIESLFNVFGVEINYIGGGAGYYSMQQAPCLFSNEGFLKDAALLALFDNDSSVGVNHGWMPISESFKITESYQNFVQSLNWEPAFDVYKKIVEDHSKQKVTKENFFDIAYAYPFSINKLGAEKIVRAPIATNNNNDLQCICTIPCESFIEILTADKQSLINAAKTAKETAKNNYQSQSKPLTLVMDCICRKLFLGDDFSHELNNISSKGLPLIGALTIGEIANNKKDYLELYNNTIVVGLLG